MHLWALMSALGVACVTVAAPVAPVRIEPGSTLAITLPPSSSRRHAAAAVSSSASTFMLQKGAAAYFSSSLRPQSGADRETALVADDAEYQYFYTGYSDRAMGVVAYITGKDNSTIPQKGLRMYVKYGSQASPSNYDDSGPAPGEIQPGVFGYLVINTDLSLSGKPGFTYLSVTNTDPKNSFEGFLTVLAPEAVCGETTGDAKALEYCAKALNGRETTVMPNRERRDKYAQESESSLGYGESGWCQKTLRSFLCDIYFPPCTPEGLTLRLCVDTCVSFATQCLERYNTNFLCNLTSNASPTSTQCEALPQGSPESPVQVGMILLGTFSAVLAGVIVVTSWRYFRRIRNERRGPYLNINQDNGN